MSNTNKSQSSPEAKAKQDAKIFVDELLKRTELEAVFFSYESHKKIKIER